MSNRQVPPDTVTDLSKHWGTRASFNPELFNNLIMQQGYRVVWEQAIFCSCVNNTSGQPDFMCPACGGKGRIYFGAKTTRALVTSISGHKDQERIGLNEQGVAYLTPMAEDNIGFRDRFTFIDSITKYTGLMVRTEAEYDKTDYVVKNFIRAMKLGVTLVEGQDYEIVDDGWGIKWISNAVAVGETYSILYDTNPVYIAMGPIHDIRGMYTMKDNFGAEKYVSLPKQFQIKREDMINDKGWGY